AAFPLEVLWLKWNLFTGLCRKIQTIHREQQRPILNLVPSRVRVTFPDFPGELLPARWLFSLDTRELRVAPPFDHPEMPPELASRISFPPSDLDPIYSAPLVRHGALGDEETVTALIRSMERIRESKGSKEGAVRGIVQTYLTSENIRAAEFSLADVFRVTLRFHEEGATPVHVWSSKEITQERGLLLNGVTEPVSHPVWENLEKARQKVFSRSSVAIYKSCHVPCDLYSLGMILMRTLLVNGHQEMAGVEQGVRRVADGIAPMVQKLGPLEGRILPKRLRTRLQEEGEIFSKDSVLFRREGGGKVADSIPDEIWYDAIQFGLRLLVWSPGFGFCENHGDYDIERPDDLMEKVTGEAERLGERIKVELFGSRQRNREILEACDLVRAELAEVKKG
ncbi:MAG TPA: hypothetical protein VFG95_09170, partial [Nitrospiria bacterium]|nr:hypothetical protein [Nitrospiria bacterium]